jgi:nucleotide-binding universal stress UspA family protein
VTRFLIPIRDCSTPALLAVRFAIEFGKRSKARLFFLFIDDPGEKNSQSDNSSDSKTRDAKLIQETIDALINCGRDHDGLQTEIHHRSGDYIQEVRQFVRKYHIAEIIVSLPDKYEVSYEQTQKDIDLLLHITHCRILTVKPKTKGI